MSRRFDIGCTVDVENRFEGLGAHVRLDGDIPVLPGDRITVHGDPIVAPYGTILQERRIATVRRAGPLRSFYARHLSGWRLIDIYEVGFDGESA